MSGKEMAKLQKSIRKNEKKRRKECNKAIEISKDYGGAALFYKK